MTGRLAKSRVLRLHLPLVVGVSVCLFAGWFELSRARAGRTIAWVYAVEWPLFAVAGIVMWWWIVTDRDARRSGDRKDTSRGPEIPPDDPGLQAWERYKAELDEDRRSPDELG